MWYDLSSNPAPKTTKKHKQIELAVICSDQVVFQYRSKPGQTLSPQQLFGRRVTGAWTHWRGIHE